MNTPSVLQLTKQLINQPSVTPEDAGCQNIMAEHLNELGFKIQHLPFADVSNLWATLGESGPLFVFAGHTDVVPTGPLSEWQSDPFEATERNGFLYGRGAADMKGSLAAMLVACSRFLGNSTGSLNFRIGFLITSDEEGPADHGTQEVMAQLDKNGIKIDYCLIGEPSSTERIGDIIKNGRRGSLSGRLTVHGQQGHIAYPHLAKNPIHSALPALSVLSGIEWDNGNEHFQPTSFQISNINAGTGVGNIIPGSLQCDFNFRFSTELEHTVIQARVHEVLDSHCVDYTLDWTLFGQAFLTSRGTLIGATEKAILDTTGYNTELSTSGGTSDGRYIAPYGTEVLELGPCNASIHKIDENVRIEDLDTLANIYAAILSNMNTTGC